MAGAVNIRLGAIVSDFVAGFRTAQAAAGQLATQLNGNLSAGFAAADRQSRQFERGIGKLGNVLQNFGRQAALVGTGIAVIGATSFKAYADINALQLGLENITGSAAAATARFNELMPVVRLPGLGLEEAVKGDVRLQAVGFSAIQAKDALLQFGNAIALTGGGKFELDSILTQLTQMGSKSKVLAEDLKPILTSSPAVAKAIREMFGTVDSELISDKLQKAGRTPMDFINDLTAKLAGLERVKGGPKNAIENLSDSLKLAQFNFGAAADKAFGLTDIINRIGDGATSLADRFAALSPVTQKIILTVTGLAVAIGPLALGIGTLLALVPSVIAGATAISATLGIAIGPIVLIGAAVVGLAAIVVTNWDTIRGALTDSGIWQSVTGLATSTFNLIKAGFTAFTGLLQILWARFGGFFIGFGKTAFEAVAGTFKFFAGLLTGVFKVLTGILSLDWFTFLDGIKTVAKSFLGLIVDAFKLMVGAVGRSIAALFQLFGGESLAEKITSGVDKALGKLDKLKGGIQSVATATKATAAITGASTGKASTTKPYDYSKIDLGGSAFEKAKDRLKALKDEIASGKLAGKDVSAQQAEYDQLKASVDGATSSFKKQNAAVGSLNPSLTTNERILKRLTYELKQQGDTADKTRSQRVALFQELVRQDKELANARPVELGNLNPLGNSNSFAGAFSALTNQVNGTTAAPKLPYLEQLKQQIDFVQQGLEEKKQQFISYLGVAKGQLAEAGVGLFENFGAAIGNGGNPLRSILQTVVNFIGDFAIKLGSAILLMGKLETVAAAIPGLAPLFALTGPAKIIVGAGLVAGGAAIKAIGNFAGGGLITGEKIIRVGENSRALAGGGEFVAPVALGANLISERIMKNIGLTTPKVNTPDMRQVRPQRVMITHQGEFRLNKGDLVLSLADANNTSTYLS